MKTELTTSIVIATFNGSKYLLKQLESINNQTIKPDEVIISDDNSTDNTVEIAEAFIREHKLSSYWKIVTNKKNGISNNFINGIQQSRGGIIFLCDQDDIWHPEKIKCFLEKFRDNNEFLCIVSSIKYMDGSGNQLHIRTDYTCNQSHKIEISEMCRICSYLGMSSAFRRSLFDITPTKLIETTSHDWALMITACNQGGLSFMGKCLQYYRLHNNNASGIKGESANQKRLKLISRQTDHLINTLSFIDEKQTIEKYINFLNLRKQLISTHSVLKLLINISNYKKMGYSLRNFGADIYAALK